APEEHSAEHIHSFVRRLQRNQLDATDVLQRSLVHRSRDFWMHFYAGHLDVDPRQKAGHFRAALAIRFMNPSALNDLGVTYKEREDFKNAVFCFEEAIKHGKLASAHANLANCYAQDGDFEKAIHHCNQAIQINPTMAEAHGLLGYIYLRKN